MIPELSKLYQLEIKEREDSLKESHAKNISDEKQRRKDELMQKLRKAKAKYKSDAIVDYIFTLGEEHEKYITLCCKKCLTSFYSGITFPVPIKYGTIRWLLIWEIQHP